MRDCVIVCSECGSTRMQVLDWVDANRDRVVGNCPGVSGWWCARCEANNPGRAIYAEEAGDEELTLGAFVRQRARELRKASGRTRA